MWGDNTITLGLTLDNIYVVCTVSVAYGIKSATKLYFLSEDVKLSLPVPPLRGPIIKLSHVTCLYKSNLDALFTLICCISVFCKVSCQENMKDDDLMILEGEIGPSEGRCRKICCCICKGYSRGFFVEGFLDVVKGFLVVFVDLVPDFGGRSGNISVILCPVLLRCFVGHASFLDDNVCIK